MSKCKTMTGISFVRGLLSRTAQAVLPYEVSARAVEAVRSCDTLKTPLETNGGEKLGTLLRLYLDTLSALLGRR